MRKSTVLTFAGFAAVLFSLGLATRNTSAETPTLHPAEGNEQPEERVCSKYGVWSCSVGAGYDYSPGCASCAEYTSWGAAHSACLAACSGGVCSDSGLVFNCPG
jgi:hypothetical protein